MANADVEYAFDSLHPREADESLAAWNLHPTLIAALLQEGVGVSGVADFEGIRAKVEISKCIRQGTVEAQRIFLATMLRLLHPPHARWIANGCGAVVDDTVVPLLLWADNVWLISSSISEASAMLCDTASALALGSFRINPSSLQYIISKGVRNTPFPPLPPPSLTPPMYSHLALDPPRKVEKVAALQVLGSWIEPTGRDRTAIDARLASADKAFWCNSNFLCCSTIPLTLRLQRFSKKIVAIVLHASSTWSISKTLLHDLAAWELGLLRKIIRPARLACETWQSFWQRTARHCRQVYIK